MAKTINQARADFKKYFKKDADENLSIEDIASAIDSAKAKVAADKAEADAKKAKATADKAEADAKKATEAGSKKPKYKATFPKVEIPKLGVFTAEELEANPAACEYLLEIGSPAVVKL